MGSRTEASGVIESAAPEPPATVVADSRASVDLFGASMFLNRLLLVQLSGVLVPFRHKFQLVKTCIHWLPRLDRSHYIPWQVPATLDSVDGVPYGRRGVDFRRKLSYAGLPQDIRDLSTDLRDIGIPLHGVGRNPRIDEEMPMKMSSLMIFCHPNETQGTT